MNPDRFFSPDPLIRKLARRLYKPVANHPIISPRGHVDARLFSDPQATFGTPVDLFITPHSHVTYMFSSQAISPETLLTGDRRQKWRSFFINLWC